MIQINNLVKKYGNRTAVDGLSLSISDGEIFGLLGPNGAGKTTTIRMLTMLTQPSAGSIQIKDCPLAIDDQQVKSLIGVVPQHLNLDGDLTARENLELHGRLHHMPSAERKERIAELLAYVELADRAEDMVSTFSGGMKRRLMIARALLHRPKVLFLDEPTVGLDPQVRRRLWDLIRKLKGEGLTVLLTTHYIEEAEHLCQRVAILDKGKLIALDTPEQLRCRVGAYVVERETEEGLHGEFFSTRAQATAFAATLTTTTTVRRSNLEDVFVELTGRKVVG